MPRERAFLDVKRNTQHVLPPLRLPYPAHLGKVDECERSFARGLKLWKRLSSESFPGRGRVAIAGWTRAGFFLLSKRFQIFAKTRRIFRDSARRRLAK